MGPEQKTEVAADTGLPAPETNTPASAAPKEGWFQKLGKMFKRATNVSKADALMGTNAGQVLPEVTQAASIKAAKTETPALTPPATPVGSK
jgi:hypothetical protein